MPACHGCRLCADSETNVQSAVQFLDALIKDIVAASPVFDLQVRPAARFAAGRGPTWRASCLANPHTPTHMRGTRPVPLGRPSPEPVSCTNSTPPPSCIHHP